MALVYTSDYCSLCSVEQLVHLTPENGLDDLTAFEIETEDLLGGWGRIADHPTCQRIGEPWARDESAPVLEMPSAAGPVETNYLINPHHRETDAIQVAGTEEVRFDQRLLRRREKEASKQKLHPDILGRLS